MMELEFDIDAFDKYMKGFQNIEVDGEFFDSPIFWSSWCALVVRDRNAPCRLVRDYFDFDAENKPLVLFYPRSRLKPGVFLEFGEAHRWSSPASARGIRYCRRYYYQVISNTSELLTLIRVKKSEIPNV